MNKNGRRWVISSNPSEGTSVVLLESETRNLIINTTRAQKPRRSQQEATSVSLRRILAAEKRLEERERVRRQIRQKIQLYTQYEPATKCLVWTRPQELVSIGHRRESGTIRRENIQRLAFRLAFLEPQDDEPDPLFEHDPWVIETRKRINSERIYQLCPRTFPCNRERDCRKRICIEPSHLSLGAPSKTLTISQHDRFREELARYVNEAIQRPHETGDGRWLFQPKPAEIIGIGADCKRMRYEYDPPLIDRYLKHQMDLGNLPADEFTYSTAIRPDFIQIHPDDIAPPVLVFNRDPLETQQRISQLLEEPFRIVAEKLAQELDVDADDDVSTATSGVYTQIKEQSE